MSEETKYTPGPWHLDSLQVGGPDRLRVADVWTSDRPITEQRANARLVASAQELLEALEACLNYFDRGYPGPFADPKESARAAIARATGSEEPSP